MSEEDPSPEYYKSNINNRVKDTELTYGWIRDLTMDGIEPNPGPNTSRRRQMRKRANKTRDGNKNPNLPLVRTVPQSANPGRRMQVIQLDARTALLNYDLTSAFFNNPGGPITLDVSKLNSPYDYLLTVFTQAIQYLNYQFDIYDTALVLSTRFDYVFGNLEQTPVDLYWFESVENPAATFGSRSALQAQAGTDLCKWRDVMSEQYGKKSQVLFTRTRSNSAILGNKIQYMGSSQYYCTATSDPARLLYGCWVACGPSSTLSSGVVFKLNVSIKIKFYGAKINTTPLLTTVSDNHFFDRIKHLTREACRTATSPATH